MEMGISEAFRALLEEEKPEDVFAHRMNYRTIYLEVHLRRLRATTEKSRQLNKVDNK